MKAKLQRRGQIKARTWKIPRLALVEVDIDHVDASVRSSAFAGELAAEVVHDELVVPGVEPEPRRQPRLHHADRAHHPSPFFSFLSTVGFVEQLALMMVPGRGTKDGEEIVACFRALDGV
jgi:hypothetical protein